MRPSITARSFIFAREAASAVEFALVAPVFILVLVGIALGFVLNAGFFGLAAFVGAGLVFAGITDFCGMGLLLAKMPWNQHAGRGV